MDSLSPSQIIPLLIVWAQRPDATTDLREIFHAEASLTEPLLSRIRSHDFSWIPEIQTLPSATLDPENQGILGAYARENATIYLSSECPSELLSSVLLEEIGHHIDALFNARETAGDEGTLFSAAVRGEILSEEQIIAILNEDDSAIIQLNGRKIAVECTAVPPKKKTPPPPAAATVYSGVSTVLPGTSNYLIGTGTGNISLTGNSLSYNYLQANSGNDTLITGSSASTTIQGGSGNDLFLGKGTGAEFFQGGSGNSTMVAGNGAATLLGGSGNNSLKAGTGTQSLVGGGGNNTLIGGTGKDTLRSGSGNNTLISGSTLNGGNTLISGGASSSLVAGAGNDSLSATTGNNTLQGGTGKDTLLGGTGNNWLQSGSTAGNGNTLIGGSGSNILVAGLGKDSIVGGNNGNVLLVTQNNLTQSSLSGFAAAKVSLSNLTTADNVLGILSPKPITIQDSLFGNMAAQGVTNLQTVEDFSSAINSNAIILGPNAQKVGVSTVVAGGGSDTISVAPFTSPVTLDGALSIRKDSLVGGSGNDLLIGSIGGFDTMIGGTGNDTFSLQYTSFGSINGGAGTNEIQLGIDSASLVAGSFYDIQNIQVLSLAGGNNFVGSLEGSGVTDIVGATGSDTLVGNVTGALQGPVPTPVGQKSITLSVPKSASGSLGFAVGQVVSGNGLQIGTTITSVNTLVSGQITLGLSYPTGALISPGSPITAWINNATLDGSLGVGDSLVSQGKGVLLNAGNNFNNTLVAAAYASNTLIGGAGDNLYKLNNIIGYNTLTGTQVGATLLPTIENNSGIQSNSTIQFTGNSVHLTDASFANVSDGAAQEIITSNGNNYIDIGNNAANIGINTIIGGVGSDTFIDSSLNGGNVYFDASKGSGNQFLSATGNGNNTLLAGSGNATLVAGDGSNSLIGGLGNNSIHSGIGNSTLDGGYGISTLQSDGGDNLFIIRNRYDQILAPDTLDPATGTVPLVGTVDSYVNFDPLQGAPQNSLTGPWEFAPETPDNSPSITKSPSFASTDLSNFYNLQNFNLLGGALYGVGNALPNSITSAAANALILGMGGNNTLVAGGTDSTLYGDSNNTYVDPDLYAYAPIDTTDQAFVDGIFGQAGNNSLVANGSGSWLDGGPGYDDNNFDGSGSNTLIGTGGNDTVIQTHLADLVSLTGGGNTEISSVDIYQVPNNVSEYILDVTAQGENSGQVTQAGQRMTAGYAAINNATGTNTGTYGVVLALSGESTIPTISATNADEMQVIYGTSDGTTYGSSGVTANFALKVGTVIPDPVNVGANEVSLSWNAKIDSNLTKGYLVEYQEVYQGTDSQGHAVSPWLTYLNGTSQDLTGTTLNPSLVVNNLPSSITDPYLPNKKVAVASYNFKVTALQTVLPAYTDASGKLIAKPVSLLGGNGNDFIFGDILDYYLPSDPTYATRTTGDVLNNNPIDPTSPGSIPTSFAPPFGEGNSPSNTPYGVFPTYENGGSGNDVLFAPMINDGSGNNFTAGEYINGSFQSVTYSGLDTLVGGSGSDTFIINNGGESLSVTNGIVSTSATDLFEKFGNESAAGQNNLVVSRVPYLSLSYTTVSQGLYVNQAWAAYSDQYIAGNQLNNTLVGYGKAGDTLVGGTGQDSLSIPSSGTLIGGTAYGTDSVAGALNNLIPLTNGGNGYANSIYRDSDPAPPGVNGPGLADNSQYWIDNGPIGPIYNYFKNSDTLVAGDSDAPTGSLLDGGAGNDSMVGGGGGDTFYVSSYSKSNNNNAAGAGDNNTLIGGGDVCVGNGGSDTIIYTGSDYYWSGLWTGSAAQVDLSYVLNDKGDGAGGQSISNLILQPGDPIVAQAVGNSTSTGVGGQLGSNLIEGNSYVVQTPGGATESALMTSLVGASHSATIDGGGVGGLYNNTNNGQGTGEDTLTAWGANWTAKQNASLNNTPGYEAPIVVAGDTLSGVGSTTTFVIGGNYTNSTSDGPAGYVAAGQNGPWNLTSYATDDDFALVTDFTKFDNLQLAPGSNASNYLIGSAPVNNAIGSQNLQGGISNNPATAANSTDFGIYAASSTNKPNLVAVVEGIALGGGLTLAQVEGINVDGTSGNGLGGNSTTNPDAAHYNYLGMGAFYNLTGSDFASHVGFKL